MHPQPLTELGFLTDLPHLDKEAALDGRAWLRAKTGRQAICPVVLSRIHQVEGGFEPVTKSWHLDEEERTPYLERAPMRKNASVCLSLSHRDFSCSAIPSVPSLAALCRTATIIVIIAMNLRRVCGLLLALPGVATAGPFGRAETSVAADAALRLIKVSESDPGTWVREDEKIENYVAKGVSFVDITGMSVGEPGCRYGPCCHSGCFRG